MPYSEYYDRGQPAVKRQPASKTQQYQYDVLRTRLTQQISNHLPEICNLFPNVRHAAIELEAFVQLNPTRTFKIFRQEDAQAETDADSNPAFLR